MKITDTISDMLIRIKNAQAVDKEQVVIPFSKMKFEICRILKEAGFIGEVEKKTKKDKKSEHNYLSVNLKYEEGHGALNGVKLISKPSRRMYIQAKDIKPVRSGYGIAIISTSKGLMSSVEARKNKIGGEIICEVW
jgi:small subunit ribosomal protein S8